MLQLVVRSPRFLAQEVFDGGSVSAQRIVRRHEPAETAAGVTFLGSRHTVVPAANVRSALLVVGKGVHQQPLLDELLPLGVLSLQVSVVVVGHDNAVRVDGQLDDVAVVVAHHPLPVDGAGRRVHQDLSPLQLVEDVLVCQEHNGDSVGSNARGPQDHVSCHKLI